MSDSDKEETNDANENEQRTRDVSESSKSAEIVLATSTRNNTDADVQQGGLLDTKILDVDTNNNTTSPRLSQPRVTRFLYFYFMLGYFLSLFICIIWGLLGTSYLFFGYPGIGLAYFGGLFIPSTWAACLLIFDFIVWNKNKDTPRRRLKIDLTLCCGLVKYRNGRELTRGWYFVIFLYIWFGILLGTPAGSWALPIVCIVLTIMTMTVIIDWQYYYIKEDFNGLYGIHINPWRYLILTSVIQFIVCIIIVLGHFLGHWKCIYDPDYYDSSTHINICHDWIPYEIMAVVYGLLLFIYFYKNFNGDPLNSNILDKRVRYYLWFMSFLLLIAIVWMIIEIFDGHVYIYDVIGFMYLWFVCPVFVTTLRAFRIR